MNDYDGPPPTSPPMKIRGIYQMPAKILTTPVEEYNLDDPDVLKEINRDFKTLAGLLDNTERGVAIAANQGGISRSMFVHRLYHEYIAVVNPYITYPKNVDVEEVEVPEGCLSLEHMDVLYGIKRYPVVYATYWEFPDMVKVINRKMDKFEAQVFQHEMDHLRGETILDRIK